MGTLGTAPRLVVGLDVGGSKVHGVLLVDGRLCREERRRTHRGVDGVLDVAAETVAALLDGGPPPDAVGVGVPGLVDPTAGAVAHAVNLGISGTVPLASLLAKRLGAPVTVENDLDVAALGAADVLGLEGDLAYLALGTGLGAGLLLGGRLNRGHGGGAGEIGHLPYRPDAPGATRCPCGQVGCLEQYASGSALDDAWAAAGRGGADHAPAPVEVFGEAAAGDLVAVRIRDGFIEAVATAVQTVGLTTGVPHIVLGGGVSQVGEPLLAAVRLALERRGSGSALLRSLDLAGRVRLSPGSNVAPHGAALAASAPAGVRWSKPDVQRRGTDQAPISRPAPRVFPSGGAV